MATNNTAITIATIVLITAALPQLLLIIILVPFVIIVAPCHCCCSTFCWKMEKVRKKEKKNGGMYWCTMLRLKSCVSDLDDLHKSQWTRDLGLVPTRFSQDDAQGEGATLNRPQEGNSHKGLVIGELQDGSTRTRT